MPYRKVTQYVPAADGTLLAVHTHLPPNLREDEEDQLSERPVVLLTNGIGTTENFWRFLVEALVRDYRVVHWDYRGHGATAVPTSGDYAITTQADDLARVTEAVMTRGVEAGPPLQVAFSMGVTVLLELYRRRPELVPAMALLSGAADAPWSSTLPLRMPGALSVVRGVVDALTPLVPLAAPAVRKLLASRLVYPVGRALGLLRKRAPRDDIDLFMKGLVAMDAKAYWGTLRALLRAHASDVLPWVTVPVLLVGASNDILVPKVEVERIRKALPHARFLMMEDAGHGGLVEDGEAAAAALVEFAAENARVRPGSPGTARSSRTSSAAGQSA
jgi:pimeloyl-ACP methyl ester carboxylesterase